MRAVRSRSPVRRHLPVTRRDLLRSAGWGGLGVLAPAWLAGCGGGDIDEVVEIPAQVRKELVLASGAFGQLVRTWSNRHQIRLVTHDGHVTLFGGSSHLDLNAPTGGAADPDGSFWIADYGNARVLHLSASLQALGAITEVAGVPLRTPADVSVFGDGQLAICDTGVGRVAVLNPDSDKGRWIGTDVAAMVAGGWRPDWDGETDHHLLDNPRVVAVSPAGELVVLDTAARRLVFFNEDGLALRSILLEGNPTSLAISPDGLCHVCDPVSRDVWSFDPDNPKADLELVLPDSVTPYALTWQDAEGSTLDRLLISSIT